VKTVQREERGWPGHFVAAAQCSFRRNTLLTCGDVRIVVSTVGEYRPPYHTGPGPEQIGCDRTHETMAFHAQHDAPYWDADLRSEVAFESPCQLNSSERTSDALANEMHEHVVDEIEKRLAAGEFEVAE
jgi:hypothetical protein